MTMKALDGTDVSVSRQRILGGIIERMIHFRGLLIHLLAEIQPQEHVVHNTAEEVLQIFDIVVGFSEHCRELHLTCPGAQERGDSSTDGLAGYPDIVHRQTSMATRCNLVQDPERRQGDRTEGGIRCRMRIGTGLISQGIEHQGCELHLLVIERCRANGLEEIACVNCASSKLFELCGCALSSCDQVKLQGLCRDGVVCSGGVFRAVEGGR